MLTFVTHYGNLLALVVAATLKRLPFSRPIREQKNSRQAIQEICVKNTKKGFTLIELLIVVVIIGILAAIAIPKFANTKDKAYVAQMKSDLRNLATYEEQYAADAGGAYFGGTATMAAPLQGFTPSQNVTIVVTNVAGPPPSWSATATHSQSAKTCDMTNGVLTCV
jgi:prepilin-type N-terminal cleavage/methylation domain-containing protein